jgi:hypothetical protein
MSGGGARCHIAIGVIGVGGVGNIIDGAHDARDRMRARLAGGVVMCTYLPVGP